VFLNAGATGYYRTAYPADMITAMAPEIQTSLTAPERLSLLGDVWAMVKAGRQTVGDFLTLASGFGDETSSGVLGQLAGRLKTIRTYLTTPETAPRLERFILEHFEPLAARLGPHTIPGEDPERTLLRAHVLDLIGGAGGDRDTLAYARSAVDDALAGRAPLDATAADALVDLAARNGDGRLFDALLAASRTSASPEERYRYLYALTQFTDQAQVARGLQLALTPELRPQDAPQFLGRYLANPVTNGQAWRFVKAHWTELQPKLLNFLGDVEVATALASFCDRASRNDIAAFFGSRRLPSGERALAQSIEHIDQCIALKAAQAPQLKEWLLRESIPRDAR
jgi:aminopeptidase N